jgi:hypothetical protein
MTVPPVFTPKGFHAQPTGDSHSGVGSEDDQGNWTGGDFGDPGDLAGPPYGRPTIPRVRPHPDQRSPMPMAPDPANQEHPHRVETTGRRSFDVGGEVGADGQPVEGGAQATQQRLTTMLVTQLRAAGVSDDMIRGILAMNQTEWNPAKPEVGFLGLMDIQEPSPQDKISEFINEQWLPRTRNGVPGVGASGEVTNWDDYMAFIRVKIMGQTGDPRDWHGDPQPPASEYQRRLMSSLGKTPEPQPETPTPKSTAPQPFTPVWTQAVTAPPMRSTPPPSPAPAPSLASKDTRDHYAAGLAHAKAMAPDLKEYLSTLALAHVVTQVGQQAKAAGLDGLMMPQ